MRMHLRRCARRTNAFSKKLEPHRAAIALHIAFYNWCRVHETLRVTPAIELGLTDHIWSIGELLREAQAAPSIAPISPSRPSKWAGRKPFTLRVIRGWEDRMMKTSLFTRRVVLFTGRKHETPT